MNIQKRFREIGRIRFGVKTASGAPKKIDTFRLTSSDVRVLEEAARLYGGKVEKCDQSGALKGQFEVIIEKNDLPIYLAPVETSQWLEDWTGGRCKRRCDGIVETISGKPCICVIQDKQICKPTTRIAVILYELPEVAGVWRLETKGWNAAAELASVAESLNNFYGIARRPLNAILRLEDRSSTGEKSGGGTETRRFKVPVISIPYTPQDIALMASAEAAKVAIQAEQEIKALETNADKEPNPRGRYFALHTEMGYPPHNLATTHPLYTRLAAIKGINLESWSFILGREITSGSQLTEADFIALSEFVERVRDDEEQEPNGWFLWRNEEHPLQGGGI